MKSIYYICIYCLALLVFFPVPLPAADQEDEGIKAFQKMFPPGKPSEEDVYRADELLISATGSLKPVYLAPSVATVITSEDIEKTGATTLFEALESVPGLHVGISPINTMEPLFSIRGIQTTLTPQTLILLNGHPITMAYIGMQLTTFKMPVNMISRIEIIRGPGSAVHGADAFSGVINIITRDGHEIDGSRVGLRYGSFDTVNTWLQHGGDYNGWTLGYSLDYMKTDGDDDRVLTSDNQTTLDGFFGTSASLAPGALDTSYELIDTHLSLIKDNWTTRLWGWMSDDSGRGDGVTNTLSEGSSADAYQYMIDLLYSNDDLAQEWQFDVRLNYFAYELDAFLQVFPAGAVLPMATDGNIAHLPELITGFALFTDGVYGNPIQKGSKASVEFTTFYEGITDHIWRLSTGFNHQQEDYEEYKNFGPGVLDDYSGSSTIDGTLTDVSGTDDIYMPDVDRDLWYFSMQDEWLLTRGWTLTGGVRYDHYSDFGDTTNPRLALVWETRYDLTTKLLYGRAFRAPSFNELYVRNNPSTLGNEDLSPETIDTVELAFDYQPLTTLRTNLNLFYYETEDLIDRVPEGTVIRSENTGSTEGRGFELEMDWRATDSLRLKANLAYQRSKYQDSEEIVPNAPGWQFYANSNWAFWRNWSLDAQYYWIGDRHRAEGDTRDDIDDYDIVNLTLRRKNIKKNWDVALSVRNVFDEDAREPAPSVIPDDYPLEGRSIWMELKTHF